MRPDAVGLGWRPEMAADLFATRSCVDFVEVVAETGLAQPESRREARALAEIWPVVPHGVKLSLGSADGIDLGRARELGALAREVHAPAISEHVAITRAGTREIGHLTTLPYTREAVRVVARNVAAARRALPDVPLLLENVAWTFRWPEDALSEGDFYGEVVAATGCPLLLDLANLYANALNAGVAPSDLLRAYPLDAVGMVHLAGGLLEDGFYVDTHAHAVPDAVFDLLAALFAETGPVPVLLERDAAFPAFSEIRAELERARGTARGARAPRPRMPRPVPEPAPDAPATEMSRRQAALARILTRPEPPDAAEAGPFGAAAIARTREILEHKRVDDALPLLRHAAARGGDALRAIALDVVRRTPRAPRAAGIADAMKIAEAARADRALAPWACMDLLELRSRFGRGRGPRLGPFIGREALPDGRSVWAFKGPGRHAPVRLSEPARRIAWGGEP